MRRVCLISTASGSGKTTLGRALATRLGVPFHELDALHHGPGWREATAEELRDRVQPLVQGDGWVIDNPYRGKLGDLVPEAADTVVWIDVPARVWLPRLLRRTLRRALRREELWNGNRETLRSALLSRDSLILYALRNHRDRRRRYPVELARFPLVRLRTQAEMDAFVAGATNEGPSGSPTMTAP